MRLYFLDNIKIALITLVVVHHAGQAYGPTDYWPIRSDDQLDWLGPFFLVNGAFFMGLFFMISAYFLPTSVDRKGLRTVFVDRLMRLGVPLLFMTLFIFGPLTYLVDERAEPFWQYMVFQYVGNGDFELAHLWFISLLLFFSIGYLGYRAVSAGRTGANTPPSAPGNLLLVGLTLGLLIINALVRAWFPVDVWVDVLPLMPVELGRLPQYLGLFIVGLIACRQGWFLSIPLRQAMLWFVLALLAIISAFINTLTDWFPNQIWLLQEALIGVGLCFSLPVLARETWSQSGPLLKRLADNAFAVYLIHVIIVFVLQEGLEATEFSGFTKFFLVSILGVLLSFILADLLRRVRPLRRFL